jgi:hypothetical protein
MFKNLIVKVRRWLGVYELAVELNRLDVRLKTIEKLVRVGIDVHTKSDSWIVMCLAGKPEYVEFFRIPVITCSLFHSCYNDPGFVEPTLHNNLWSMPAIDKPFLLCDCCWLGSFFTRGLW